MCTVTWTAREDEGYQLVFSRDEQRSRPTALAPRVTCVGDVALLAPQDPQGGGTWILSNGHGLTACLLNYYAAPSPPDAPSAGRESRGRLLQSLGGSSDPVHLGQRLAERAEAGRHLPFTLLTLAPGGSALAWVWDGRALSPRAAPTPGIFSTSSVEAARIVPARLSAFAAWRADSAADLPDFHRAASAVADAFSVRMSRPDARTVSLTEVVCAPHLGRLSMSYAPREDDGHFTVGHTWQLPLSHPQFFS